MRFLSVAERELRAAARRKGTYRLRWVAGIGFFVLLLWLAWAFDLFANRNNAPEVFRIFAVMIFLFCLLVGATSTADSISREKREGTLGLLFLTNLNSAEIVAGKLCAHGLAAAYCLLAIFPVLALPLMVGGITFAEFGRVVLAEVNALFFALAAGFVASAVSRRPFTAVGLATVLVIFFGLVVSALASSMRALSYPRPLTELIASFCPLNTLMLTSAGRRTALAPDFWSSLGMVATLSLGGLAFVMVWLRCSWRDRPKSPRPLAKLEFLERRRAGSAEARLRFRRRLLAINPFFWLAGRQRVTAPVFMVLVVVLCAFTSFLAAPYFDRVMRVGIAGPVFGHMFAWLWSGLAIHALVLYYAATSASRQLAEDKQNGALELILSTPMSEPVIARGLWLAYARRMLFPALAAVLVHGFFVWTVLNMALLDPPGKLPPGATAGEIFWSALRGVPLRGHELDWPFGFMLRVVLLFLAGCVAAWIMLGWLGRWLGLRLKHPGFAPLVSLALAFAPPILLFSLVCYFGSEWGWFRLPERRVLPLMMWIAFGIWLLNCAVLSWWAAGHLRVDFRATVIGRFDDSSRRWWEIDWRRARRVALAGTALLLALASLVGGFYGYQNRRSRRAWQAFQIELTQKGASLAVAPVLPRPVPDAENFARTPAFQELLAGQRTNAATASLFNQMQGFQIAGNLYANPPMGLEWTRQQPTPLSNYVAWINPRARLGGATNSAKLADSILQGLESQATQLRALADAAKLPSLQFTTNTAPATLLAGNFAETTFLERLHALYQIRAAAALAAGRTNDAAEDVLTGLRLARLARQLPDFRATLRVQFLLGRTLQPLWEGLAGHHWSEPQLAAFQRDLASFNLLADHTNLIHRTTLFYVDDWRRIGTGAQPARPPAPVNVNYRRDLSWQPSAWRLDNCIQLYRAAERARARVDVAGERVQGENSWEDTSGLPLDTDLMYLFQQAGWWANPAQVSFAQTSVNQAILACALERYFLVQGKYPESVEELIPNWLERIPRDTQRGRPLIYQTSTNNQFIIRGVGQNRNDDRNAKGGDDWLWKY